MKRLLLHIGTHKTASTSLQAFLMDNASALEQQGIFYPEYNGHYEMRGESYQLINYGRNGFPLRQATRLINHGSKYKKAERREIEKEFKRILELTADKDTVLLSDERISYEGAQDETFWPALKDVLKSNDVEEVRFLLYLRRQDEFGSSMWRQLCKGSNRMPIDAFLQKRILDYRSWIEDLESTFGSGCISIRVYDRSLFESGSIFRDFCAMAGIAWQDDFSLPESELNESFSEVAAEVKRWANETITYRRSSNFLYEPALRLPAEADVEEKPAVLTRELFERLRDEHASDNEYIAQKYLNGRSGNFTVWPRYSRREWPTRPEDAPKAVMQMLTDALSRTCQQVDEQQRVIEEQALKLDGHLRRIEEQADTIDEMSRRIARLEADARSGITAKIKRNLLKKHP